MRTSAVCLHLFHGSRAEPSGFEGSALSLPGGDPVSAVHPFQFLGALVLLLVFCLCQYKDHSWDLLSCI